MKVVSLENPKKQFTVTTWKYPGGEIGVRVNDFISIPKVIIKVRITNSDELMELLLVTDALKREGVNHIELEMPYIPYARQDRVMTDGESLSIKVFADLINSQGYKAVYVMDAHSPVALALINNVVDITNHTFVAGVFHNNLERATNIVLVSPDAGAAKKIEEVAKVIKYTGQIVTGKKNRDLATGKITHTSVDATMAYLTDKHCVIVDDICDGGRTFIELAKVLKSRGASRVTLIVTHGIFSAGFKELGEYIDSIYTTNSFQDIIYAEEDIPLKLEITQVI